jgi:citrate synthase
MPEIHKGLEDIYIDTSTISRVFGEEGKLTYRGYWIQDLARRASYEEVVYLLLNGELPDHDEREDFNNELVSYRAIDDDITQLLRNMEGTAPMDVLRTAVSALSEGIHPGDFDSGENRDYGIQIIAKIPTIVAHFDRIRKGKEPVEPDETLSHAGNFYYMLHGERPTDIEEEAVNTALILYAEHGMNASSFASVVAASTLADMYSCITAGIGALQGSLHGGATETVVDMLDQIDTEDDVDPYVDGKLENHEVIPGFGHRVYKTTDPRCAEFARVYKKLSEEEGEQEQLTIIEHLRDRVVDELGDKGIYPNADLYSGTVYNALGIDHDLYTGMFTMARVTGWVAHVLEQWEDNRILRPRARYSGELDREFVPLDER